jgi:hypothetical protein
MTQLHKRLTDDQVKVLLHGYCQGLLARAEIQEMLSVDKSRFFALLREYRKNPEAFSIAYESHTPGRLPAAVEMEIERELLREKAIVEDKRLPISGYNYSALQDRLKKKSIKVSVTTIIDRAKRLDCLSWPNNTSVLQSAVMEEESLVADGAESGESVDTAAQSSGYPHHPMA